MVDTQRTLVLIKPDGIQRGIALAILSRFERRGLRIAALKLVHPSTTLAEEHYAEHRERPFFRKLVSYITSSPVVAVVLEAPEAVSIVRELIGKTNPVQSAAGTIRADFGVTVDFNLIHGSASVTDAEREIALWFRPEEIFAYSRAIDAWVW